MDRWGGPSEGAREAYGRALEAGLLYVDPLDAAHDPALGLDRSVCLRDVVERLNELAETTGWKPEVVVALRYAVNDIEREFSFPEPLAAEAKR